ncbi:bifunctional acetate--CoA ligase family protein/GNAT family N-acetyltransferase [Thalassiella azotivora]
MRRQGRDRAGEYPSHWEADVVLRDGGIAHVRPIRTDDADALQRFHVAQSPESVYLRFFAPMPRLSEKDLERFTHVDHRDRVALVATTGEEIIGVGRYDRVDGRQAEVAFNISDHHQGRGLGSVLLEHLAAAARERGIHRFVAEVLPQNRKMVGVFRDAGYEVTHHYDDGVISLAFDIDPTQRSMSVMAAREHRAEAESIKALLNPSSVVVVGASRSTESVGGALLRNLVDGGFTGAVHAVNPEALELYGVQVHARVEDVPGPVDLAVVAVPAPIAVDVVRACGGLGVKGVVVVSSGFAETGSEGLERQRELVRVARTYGMRVVGPNSFGMLNTDPGVALNASLAPWLPRPGRLGLFSQSGALGVAVLSSADRRGLGVSGFVSAGNRADVSGNDLMQFWEEDPRTATVGLYLESVGNPRKFSRVARRLARSKPVVVVKSGVSGYGVPPGHAVRSTRAPRGTLDAMLRQAGVIRVENIHQLFDVSQVLVDQPLPAGERVGVVGNSDALGALVAEAALSWGLELAREPVSLHPEADAATFRAALEDVFADPGVDSVVASFIPPLATVDREVARALVEVAGGSDKTCVACFLGMRGVGHQGGLAAGPPGGGGAGGGQTAQEGAGTRHVVAVGDEGPALTEGLPTITAASAAATPGTDGAGHRVVPAYPSPEDAVRALAAVTRHAQWRRRDPGTPVAPADVDVFAAHVQVEEVLSGAPGAHPAGIRLDDEAAARLLGHVGVDVWPAVAVRDADAAVTAAEELGWPVVLKAATPNLRHRRELGGVRLDVGGPSELRRDLAGLRAELGDLGDGFLVQRMAPPGVTVVVRSIEDPLFGPVVSFGLAGDAIELLEDVAHRIPPLTDTDVSELVRSVRASPRLFGYRGAPPVDVEGLEDLVARVSVLADEVPEVAELELNPVIVGRRGVAVLGAAVRLARPAGRTDSGVRRAPSA